MGMTSGSELLKRVMDASISLPEAMIEMEREETGREKEEILDRIGRVWDAMERSVADGVASAHRSVSGLSGGDGQKLGEYRRNKETLVGPLAAKALMYAVSVSELNASMGVIVACPTAGSCGIVPSALLAVAEKRGFSRDARVEGLLIAGGVGKIIASRATLSGAEGGCQAECGSAAAMAAAGVCHLCGGTAQEVFEAAALSLKNCLGLACDPVAGLVEVPCIKRNGIFVVQALTACDMALAGVQSKIPFDEVADAMYAIGVSLPAGIRETATGGLAVTPTGTKIREALMK